jgi:hypothetical protein
MTPKERALRGKAFLGSPWNAVCSPDPVAARKLCELLGGISDDYCSAGWMIGIEYAVWCSVLRETLTGQELSSLKSLSEQCGGWIVWKVERDQFDLCLAETWVPMDEWLRLYQEDEKRGGRRPL